MFDPEKVERTPAFMCTGIETEYVLAEDYDQLLELYRQLQHEMNMGMHDARQAAAKNYGQR